MEQLERELVYLENRANQLEFDKEEFRQQLESAHKENETLLRDGAAGSRKPARRRAANGSGRDLSPPDVELPDDGPVPPYDGPPEIQPPGPDVMEGENVHDESADDEDRSDVRDERKCASVAGESWRIEIEDARLRRAERRASAAVQGEDG